MESKRNLRYLCLVHNHPLLVYIFFQFDKEIFILQTKYIKEMLEKFRVEYCALVNTPLVTCYKLNKYDESS